MRGGLSLTYRLVPPENQRPTWERDYWAIREMFYR